MKGSRGNRPSGRTIRPKEPNLPPGSRLGYSDPEVITLRSSQEDAGRGPLRYGGYLREMIERETWEDYQRSAERST